MRSFPTPYGSFPTPYNRSRGGAGDVSDVVISDPPAGSSIDFDLDQGNKVRHVLVATELVLSGADDLILEFRRASDQVWEQGAAAYRYTRYFSGATETDPVNAANIAVKSYSGVATDALNVVAYFSSAGDAAPTTVEGRCWADNDGCTFDGYVAGENIHDRVRLRTAGGATIDSGTVELIRNTGSTVVETVTLSGETTHTFTPPADAWCTEIIGEDISLSADTEINARVDSVATSTYRYNVYGNNFDLTANIAQFRFIQPGGDASVTANLSGCMRVFGLQLDCPTVAFSRNQTLNDNSGTRFWGGVEVTGGVNSSIEIYTEGGQQMTGGKLYAVHHIRPNSVIEKWTIGTENAHEFTGINKENSLMLIGSGVTFASNDRFEMHFGAGGGPTYQEGASDYQQMFHNAGSKSGTTQGNIVAEDGNAAGADFVFGIEGFNLAARSTVWDAFNNRIGDLAPLGFGAYRNDRGKHNSIRLQTVGSNNANGGAVWLIGAQ